MTSPFDTIAQALLDHGKSNNLASHGRFGDTMVAHISPDEARLLEAHGGSGTINPQTGLPEFFNVGHFLKKFAPIAASVLGFAIGGPAGAAIGAGLGSAGVQYSQTHNLGDALKAGALSAGGSYIGSNVAGSLLGNLGTVGSTLGVSGSSDIASQAASQELGELGGSSGLPWAGTGAASSDIASALGGGVGRAASTALSTPISSIVGGVAGNNIASQYAPGPTPAGPPAPWAPTRAGAAGLPSSLNSMSSLTPEQQASGLATQGVYGGGNGPQEQAYYGNLINRQLVNSGGQVSSLSSLSPIEQSYNSKLFGDQADSNSLLKALSQWNPSA